MNKKQKKMLIRILITIVLLVALNLLHIKGVINLGLYLVTYVIIGYDILKKAGSNNLFLLFFTLYLSYLVHDGRTVHIGGSAVHLLKVK